jgi:RNA polymerase-binding transcription factor DksA
MASQECLDRCRENLLSWRTEVEDEIIRLRERANAVQRKDFEPQSGQFHQELSKIEALCNAGFAKLKKVNVRISEIEKRTFLGVCLECREDMGEEALENNPLRILCINCQKAENDGR